MLGQVSENMYTIYIYIYVKRRSEDTISHASDNKTRKAHIYVSAETLRLRACRGKGIQTTTSEIESDADDKDDDADDDASSC